MINETTISVTTTKPKRLIQPNPRIGSTCGDEDTFEFKSGKVWGLRTFATPATRWLHSTARWNVSSQDPRWNVCRICCYTLRAASNALTNYIYRAAACADRLFLPRSTYLRRVWLTRATQPLTRSCWPGEIFDTFSCNTPYRRFSSSLFPLVLIFVLGTEIGWILFFFFCDYICFAFYY